jgi:hypothetical protein
MQIGSRFTEYGLTGGFFWICQLVFLVYSGQATTLLSRMSTVHLPQIQDPRIWQIGSTAISSLVAALAIIAVFVAGLVLDLLAVYFRRFEMLVFQEHLARNRNWLGRLIADHKAYCETDYEEFERRFGGTSPARDTRPRLGISLLWNRERRQQYVAAVKGKFGVARAYERLWSFFASYVLVESGSSQLSLMVDQYYLWRTGRAVSTSLAILFLEIWFLAVGSTFHLGPRHEVSFLVSLFPLALTFASVTITRETYSRLCFTLFGLVYVTQDKRDVELAKTA